MTRTMILTAVLCLTALATPQATTPAVEQDAVTIPEMLCYQGKLTDTLGQPVPDGNYPMMFLLYTVPSGGSLFWSENQSVTTKDGLFSVLLGSVTPISSIPDAGAVYLGMTVSGGPELTPRIRIASAAFAYLSARSANADLLQGRDTTGFVRTGQTSSVTSAMITDATVAAADLGQMGASSGQVMKWTGSAWSPRNDSLGGGDGAWTRGSDSVLYTTHFLGLARGGAGNSLQDSAWLAVNFGVSCTTIANAGYSGPTVSGGRGNYARYGSAVGGGYSNRATGTHATIAGGGNNTASESYCVAAGNGNQATGISSITAGGVLNTASAWYSTVGGGIHNVASGRAATVAGGESDSALSSFSGVLSGLRNQAGGTWTDSGAVVCGGIDNNALAKGSVVVGGRSSTVSASSRYSLAAGIGSTVTAGDTNAAAFNGTTTSADRQLRCYTLAQGFGVLGIDDPRDPTGAIINQYSVGSSEALLTYRGAAVIGAGGRVTVFLPDDFDVLNRNPMVQLTGVGTSDVYVAEDVAGNSFAIGGRPGTKVYWTVTGERKDDVAADVRAAMPVEQPKTNDLRGRSVNGLW